MSAVPKLIAFYLPQYHPIPENDRWWGRGFTEWTNVAKAQPLFPGHYQPHLPADLGFYDLRLPEARAGQSALAREHGIDGFCYYHYWFGGRRVLERPFNEVLSSGEPDFPFCLCWANENWTRTWDGLNEQVLLAQEYSETDDLAHIRWLCSAFADQRYMRVDGKPLFLVYRAMSLPDPRRTTATWREEAARLGIGELCLARVESNFPSERGDPRELGFDVAVEFQPDALTLFESRRDRVPDARVNVEGKWQLRGADLWFTYREVVEAMLAREAVPYPRFAGVSPGWDNTPRRGAGAGGITDSSPAEFERWLTSVTTQARTKLTNGDPAGAAVFINAWNEWGEGCHLEPCQKWGRAYLGAVTRALAAARAPVA
jgi:hypothetical protein